MTIADLIQPAKPGSRACQRCVQQRLSASLYLQIPGPVDSPLIWSVVLATLAGFA